jgi:hypothetical protein
MTNQTISNLFSHYLGVLASRLALGPEHLAMYVVVRFQVVRLFMVWLHGQRHPVNTSLSGSASALVESLDVDRAVECLKQDGFFPGMRLLDSSREAIRKFCESTIC